ncbi:MAG: hypothetical protein NFCOHLIN_01930 [Gammaproteobacteria bacterium]|nr:hypothetical protein [Gammaproteobacteria bacterium]
MSKARHGIALVVGSLIPIAGHAAAVGTGENPFRTEERVQGDTQDRGAGQTMLAQGYCGGMPGWQGGYGGMNCGAGMSGMRGGMMGGPMMGGGMMGDGTTCGGMMGGGMMGGMGMMRMMDTDQDGKISKEEMARHQEWMMKALDTNGDGQIDALEMMGMGGMRRMNPQ